MRNNCLYVVKLFIRLFQFSFRMLAALRFLTELFFMNFGHCQNLHDISAYRIFGDIEENVRDSHIRCRQPVYELFRRGFHHNRDPN